MKYLIMFKRTGQLLRPIEFCKDVMRYGPSLREAKNVLDNVAENKVTFAWMRIEHLDEYIGRFAKHNVEVSKICKDEKVHISGDYVKKVEGISLKQYLESLKYVQTH